MPLTDFAEKNAVIKEKPYRIADGKGLALLLHPNGSKYWQFRYRYDDNSYKAAVALRRKIVLYSGRSQHALWYGLIELAVLKPAFWSKAAISAFQWTDLGRQVNLRDN